MEAAQVGKVCPLAALAVQIAIAAFGDTIHDGVGGPASAPAPAPKLSDSAVERN